MSLRNLLNTETDHLMSMIGILISAMRIPMRFLELIWEITTISVNLKLASKVAYTVMLLSESSSVI